MPGKHSPERLAARRLRGIQRGFIKQRQNEATTATSSGFDRVVGLQANIGDACGVSQPLSSDHVAELDPWAGASLPKPADAVTPERADVDPWASYLKPVLSEVTLASVQEDTQFDGDGACGKFMPPVGPPPAPPPLSGVCGVSAASELHNAQLLIESQNYTIAMLTARLEMFNTDECMHGKSLQGRSHNHVEDRLSKLEITLDTLEKSLKNAVMESVALRCASFEERFALLDSKATGIACDPLIMSKLEEKIDCIREVTNEKLLSVTESLNASFADQMRTSIAIAVNGIIDRLPKLGDSITDRCDKKLSSRLEDFETRLHGIESTFEKSNKIKIELPTAPLCGEPPGLSLHIGEYVRLVDLKSAHLNGRCGEITSCVQATGRYGVTLHGEEAEIAIFPKNLAPYIHRPADLCVRCNQLINLNAFPACDCPPRSASRNSGNPATSSCAPTSTLRSCESFVSSSCIGSSSSSSEAAGQP